MAEPTATPILYLDVDDEITSAAARIRRVEGDRLAIVVPFGSRLATSRINFRLLAREASEWGKTIEIVAPDASARALASSAGLLVHPSVAAFEGRSPADGAIAPTGPTNGAEPASGSAAAAEDTATKVLTVSAAPRTGAATPRSRDRDRVPLVGPPRPPVRTGVAVGAGLVLLVLLVVGAWAAVALLPTAMITLAPRAEPAGPLSLTVEARPDVTAPDAAALLIPARRFTFELEVTDSFAASGVKVTETKATGTVQFSNIDAFRSRRIDAGSIVATETKEEFVLLADVTLPAAGLDFSDPLNPRIIPSTSSVAVEAVAAGESGNVNNNTITVLPKGVNKNAISVTNPEPTTGGARTESPQVSQADVDAALAALGGRLREELDARVDARDGVPAGTTLFAETATLGEASPSVDPASLVGAETAEFEVGLTAAGTVLGVDPAPLEVVARQRVTDRVPEGWRIAEGSVAVDVGEPSVFGESVTFPVSVNATRVRIVDPAAIVAEVRGLLLAEARARLERFGDVEISLWPDWVTNVPTDPSKVTVTILEPRAAP